MENLPANIWKLIIFLIALMVIFDILLVRLLKVSKLGWKKIEYVWLFLAVLSLISASAQVRIWLAGNRTGLEYERAEIQYDRLKNWIGGVEPPVYICMQFHHTSFSPENIDKIQSEYNQLCDWNKELLMKLADKISGELPSLEYSKYKPPKLPENPVLRDYLRTVEMYFNNYEETRNEYLKLKSASIKNGMEELFFYFTPVLLCIALALRITKVTGEIKLGT